MTSLRLIVLGLAVAVATTAALSLAPRASSTPPSSTVATAISAGGFHTCAVTGTGGVKCWGSNQYGGLGDGTTTDRTLPVAVSGLTSGIAAVSAGFTGTCALTTGGGVVCWGVNVFGEVGDGTKTPRLTPVPVSGLGTGVKAVAAGGSMTCVLTTAGGVKCWGNNTAGALGDGTTNDHLTPQDVTGLTSGVRQISAGNDHVCAVTSAGGAVCWGSNAFGQLGDGTKNDRWAPVPVTGLGSGVAAVSAGLNHSCAIMVGGTAKCWGSNWFGELGNAGLATGLTVTSTTPVTVGGFTNGATLGSGWSFNCALTTLGAVDCWGWDSLSQLGDGTRTDSSTPVGVTGLGSGIVALTSGVQHSCALTGTGGITCWGYNGEGEMGNGTVSDHSEPVAVPGFGASATAYGYTSEALAGLAGLVPTGSRDTDRRIRLAIARLTTSIERSRWIDDDRIVSDLLFAHEKEAVQQLAGITGPVPAGASNAIAAILQADGLLARTMIDDRASGNARKLNDAKRELAKAQAAIAGGSPAAAIGHFKNAWVFASRA